ncbi:MAG: DUF2294 domain-containing protein [Chloroflexi bacterium]|nr:DUF2294 domain-containing protein [Chloroflexota bacterium]
MTKSKPTRGQAEAEFTQAIIRFEKEYLGRGPVDARTYFIKDMILVRLQGVLTPAELKLAETKDGRSLIKETRRLLFESSRQFLEEMVQQVTGALLISLHTDMSSRTGERVILLTVDRDLEKVFK